MTWIYLGELTDSTYLAESEESASHLENGLDQSLIAKSTPIVKECSSQEWMLMICAWPPCGMMFPPWKGSNSEDLSTSFTGAFHARGLAVQDLEKAWQMSEADYFSRCSDCVARLSPDSSSWRMYQPLLAEEDSKWCDPLPRWGMIVDGVLSPLRPLERLTRETDGFFWPTPTARDWKSGSKGSQTNSRPLSEIVGGALNPIFVEWLMGFPLNWTCLSSFAKKWMNKGVKKNTIRKRSQRLISLIGKSCELCGSIEKLQRHHPNYTSEDCKIYCQECHKTEHLKENSWGRGSKKEANCIICGKSFIPLQNKQNKLCGNPNCLKTCGKLSAKKRWEKNSECIE